MSDFGSVPLIPSELRRSETPVITEWRLEWTPRDAGREFRYVDCPERLMEAFEEAWLSTSVVEVSPVLEFEAGLKRLMTTLATS